MSLIPIELVREHSAGGQYVEVLVQELAHNVGHNVTTFTVDGKTLQLDPEDSHDHGLMLHIAEAFLSQLLEVRLKRQATDRARRSSEHAGAAA